MSIASLIILCSRVCAVASACLAVVVLRTRVGLCCAQLAKGQAEVDAKTAQAAERQHKIKQAQAATAAAIQRAKAYVQKITPEQLAEIEVRMHPEAGLHAQKEDLPQHLAPPFQILRAN